METTERKRRPRKRGGWSEEVWAKAEELYEAKQIAIGTKRPQPFSALTEEGKQAWCRLAHSQGVA
jgi:hypothetical protein